MKDLTLNEYKELRRNLNDKIRTAIEEFESETGMTVESLKTTRQYIGKDESGRYKHKHIVRIDIDI